MNEEKEQMAIKISKVLNGLCPAFSIGESSALIWQRSNCSVNSSGSCTCVWHLESDCEAGKWSQLAFIDGFVSAEEQAKNSMLIKVQQVIRDTHA